MWLLALLIVSPVRAFAQETSGAAANDWLLWVGGALIILGLGVAVFFRGSMRRPRASDSDDLYEELKTKPPTRQGLDPAVAAALSPTQPMRIPSYSTPEEDELLITTVLFDEKFRRTVNESASEVVGWLRLDEKPPRDYTMTHKGMVIGRSRECDVIVRGDPQVSRKHAQIAVDATGKLWIERLSATNPILVGGTPVTQRRELRPRDIIQLSLNTRFIFISAEAVEDSPASTAN